MTIRQAILGLLFQQPQTGYDLKKTISSSSILHWSGNNNQIYTTLIQLKSEGCVESDISEPGGYPARKVYRLTSSGKAELLNSISTPPAPPEMKNHFLIQFLFADTLPAGKLAEILDAYAEELSQAIAFEQEQSRRSLSETNLTPGQRALQQLAAQNLADHYTCELNWVAKVRKGLNASPLTTLLKEEE